MLAQDFEDWLTHMGFSGREAGRQLGLSKDTVLKYRKEGCPLYVALACAALAFNLPPWRQNND